MGLLDLIRKPDINEGLKKFRGTPGAVLLDVRDRTEFKDGRIPGARNLPVSEIKKIGSLVARKETPIFVYCLSGSRARSAVRQLRKLDYRNVESIGGIEDFRGKRVKGL